MTATIIAHDPVLRSTLSKRLAQVAPSITAIGEAANLAEASALLQNLRPNLVLLSTDLPDAPGLCLLDRPGLPAFDVIVFDTKTDWAYEAMQRQVLGFLLLPFSDDSLAKVLEKLQRRRNDEALLQQFQLMMRGSSATQRNPDRIVLHLSESVHVLPLGDTVRLESEGNYTTFHTTSNERIMVTKPIGEFEHLTLGSGFFRVHQSHIVNINFVRKVLKEDGCSIVLDNNVRVPLARRRKEEFFRALGV